MLLNPLTDREHGVFHPCEGCGKPSAGWDRRAPFLLEA